ncbi:uncharacterized protein LY89DRAFT_730809 [Mollisia scopiformis]|uniref:Uncharacterized protein n=1 Tax=Mollisia scopiformis TaxID=149040 RepID=A0A194XL22_MOLSC|nr:uncharacterized protein LY89DRAFT_730809 [Mollisia scopiformis]KUJ20794.1 hypothetical protein LY89DRAFT_730809 [Mollisia scopiformis]
MSSTSHPTFSSEPQVIDGQFLDQRKLMRLLKDVYGTSEEGKNNFRVELRLNRYRIYPLARSTSNLTEDQIEDCRAIRRR